MRLSIMGMDLETKWIEFQYEGGYCVTQYFFREGEEPWCVTLIGDFDPSWESVWRCRPQRC